MWRATYLGSSRGALRRVLARAGVSCCCARSAFIISKAVEQYTVAAAPPSLSPISKHSPLALEISHQQRMERGLLRPPTTHNKKSEGPPRHMGCTHSQTATRRPRSTRHISRLLALRLLDAAHLLVAVLTLLALLARDALRLAHSKPRQPVLWLVLLRCYQVVVDHAEACAPAAAKGHLEAVEEDTARVGHLSEWRERRRERERRAQRRQRRRRSTGRSAPRRPQAVPRGVARAQRARERQNKNCGGGGSRAP